MLDRLFSCTEHAKQRKKKAMGTLPQLIKIAGRRKNAIFGREQITLEKPGCQLQARQHCPTLTWSRKPLHDGSLERQGTRMAQFWVSKLVLLQLNSVQEGKRESTTKDVVDSLLAPNQRHSRRRCPKPSKKSTELDPSRQRSVREKWSKYISSGTNHTDIQSTAMDKHG